MKTENELIASFMGVQEKQSSFESYMQEVPYWFTENNLYRTYARTVPGSSFSDFIQNSKYHESWDWLMPVVEKINSLDGYSSINMDCDRVFCHRQNDKMLDFGNRECGSKINAVYSAVVEFIKWHNKQPKL